MEPSKDTVPRVVNRGIVILRPKQPFVDWVNQTFALSPAMSLAETKHDCTAILVPDRLGSAEEVLEYLEPIKPELLEMELASWTDDQAIWPEERGPKLVDAWLDLEVHSVIFDLVPEPLEWQDEFPPPEGTAGAPLYQLKVTLKGSKPPIWRRLLVRSDVPLERLHEIIQTAMGWWNSHLHQFSVGQIYYGVPNPDDFFEVQDERLVTLEKIAPGEGARFEYEYDFGDSWLHQVLVEKVLPASPDTQTPVCLKGRRACPPEDVGGIWSYYNFLDAIADPDHAEHDTYVDWVGEEFDPDAFDLTGINEALLNRRYRW